MGCPAHFLPVSLHNASAHRANIFRAPGAKLQQKTGIHCVQSTISHLTLATSTLPCLQAQSSARPLSAQNTLRLQSFLISVPTTLVMSTLPCLQAYNSARPLSARDTLNLQPFGIARQACGVAACDHLQNIDKQQALPTSLPMTLIMFTLPCLQAYNSARPLSAQNTLGLLSLGTARQACAVAASHPRTNLSNLCTDLVLCGACSHHVNSFLKSPTALQKKTFPVNLPDSRCALNLGSS